MGHMRYEAPIAPSGAFSTHCIALRPCLTAPYANGTDFCTWKTANSSIDLSDKKFFYIYEVPLVAKADTRHYGFGVINLHARNGVLEPEDGHFTAASIDGGAVRFTLQRKLVTQLTRPQTGSFAMNTLDYVATDNDGLAAASTRTVIPTPGSNLLSTSAAPSEPVSDTQLRLKSVLVVQIIRSSPAVMPNFRGVLC